MGLPAALNAHAKSDLNLLRIITKELSSKRTSSPSFQIMSLECWQKRSISEIYEQGLALYPEDRGISLIINLIKDESPFKTEIYIDLLAEKILLLRDHCFGLPNDFGNLDELELYSWSYEITRFLLNISEPSAVLLINLYKIALQILSSFDQQQTEYIMRLNLVCPIAAS